MSYYEPVNNPPQTLLDYLLEEERKRIGPCQDCGAAPGEPHTLHCDVARCLSKGGQRISCGCGNCGMDIWTGIWPGVMEAHQWGYVCLDTYTHTLQFDLNRTVRRILLKGV